MNRCATLPPPRSPARRAAIRHGLAALAAAFAIQRSDANKLDKVRLKIAADTAPAALAEFIRQTGLQVLFDFDAIRNFTTHEVSGQFDAEEALLQMFEGSGLVYEFINEKTIAVRPRSPAATPASPANAANMSSDHARSGRARTTHIKPGSSQPAPR